MKKPKINRLRIFTIIVIVAALVSFAVPPIQSSNTMDFLSPLAYHYRNNGLYLSAYRQVPLATDSLTSEAKAVVAKASSSVVYINAYKDVPTYTWQIQQDANQIYAALEPTGTSSREVSSGSGFFITSSGYVLTNKHVVGDKQATYKVDYNGTDIAAQVVYRDPDQDLAIVKIDGADYPTLTLGDSANLKVGQDVVTIGNALGRLTDHASGGSVVSLSEDAVVLNDEDESKLSGAIETSAQLLPGDSGGPLLDMSGQVIAVNTAALIIGRHRFMAGFSIPINKAKETIDKAGISW